ncbi:CDP-glycerol glycerophosphotransferase family protein [Nonomuraea sp. NPDC050556]|uniref:bifunctional glycosyltransferase/CDP-glycerol:glycerophosphate glycerophosphotransferase n=1 Tax=Nonomuraea sp. NPDC050556 TaxID=3364369 RepID=UPI0037A973A5
MSPKLSVVVPFYNVEADFAACLDSLAGQSLADLEVVMVDDGSMDGSAVIAKTYATRDPRFRLVTQENQGLGPARNTGVRHAGGEYLAFADSDDVVAPNAYERMVGTLERSGSDLVTGAVLTFDSARSSRASFYGDAFRTTRTGTHVSRDPELLNDRTAWNKVFRRSFWDAHAFAFPTGAYEDAPVTLPAHVLATGVDVLRDVVYHYRRRESGELSITQRRTEASNLRDRISSVQAVSRFLGRRAPALKGRYDLLTLANDLMIFINVVEEGDEEFRDLLCTLVSGYLREIDGKLLARLPSLQRLKYHLVSEHRVDDLIAVREYERTGLPVAPARTAGLLRRRWYAGHPFRDDPDRPVPAAVYDMTAELRPHAQIDEITWDGPAIRLSGHAYIPGLDMSLDDRIELWLQHSGTRLRKHRLRVRRTARPEVTANSGQAAACYDGSGFEVEIDPAALRSVPGWRKADWKLHATVRVGRLKLSGPVTRCGPAAQWPRFRTLFGKTRVQAVQTDDRGVVVRFRPVAALVTGHGPDEITVWANSAQETVVLTCRERGTSVELPVEKSGEKTYRCRLPLDALTSPDRLHWDLWVRSGESKVRVAVTDDFADSGKGGLVLTRTRHGNATLAAGPPRLLAHRVGWEGDRLVISGEYGGAEQERPGRVEARRRRTGVVHDFPITWAGSRFEAALDLAEVVTLAGALPLACGTWDLVGVDGPGRTSMLTPTRELLADLPPAHRASGFEYRVWPSRGGESLHVTARRALPDDERGPYAQRLLRERDYPAFLARPGRELVVFESFFGWQYSCNPKALYEEFRRRDTGHELVWVTGDQPFHLPDGGSTVVRHSREYLEVTAAASIVVNNVAQPTTYRKRPGQTYVQTWHGTPIKSVGFDMNWSRMERRDQRRRELADDVSRWDVLLTQNPFSTEVMRRAFRFEGEVLEYGYPRNDLLHRPGNDRVRARVRALLGLRDDQRAVLYAPTWRDHLQTAGEGLRAHRLGLDLERAAAVLGQDTVLLLRRHHLLNAPIPAGCEAFVRDVTRFPDIGELFLAADAFVTDYSSAMCDFAGLGKPILLFAPDLEAYSGDVRGLAYDLVAGAPGPVLRTSDELVDALLDLDAVAAASAEKLAAFARTFCPHDDGGAAARVVDRLLFPGV